MNLMQKMFGAALCLILPAAAAAQQDWETQRTPDGQPDLQGVWTNSSQTPLVRPEEFGDKGFLTREEAQDVEQGWRDRYNLLAQPIDPERGPPTDGNADFGYNSFWWDPRDDAIEINGEYRTSIIVDPPDGQIPYVEGGAPGHDLRTAWRNRPGALRRLSRAAAGRALPADLRLGIGPAHAADPLQQQLPDRADARLFHDPG